MRARPTLVVSGEPSGDALAREVLPELPGDLLVYGRGAQGMAEVVGSYPDPYIGLPGLARSTTQTLGDLLMLARTAHRRGVRVAVLVNWTEASAILGRALRRRGIRVLQLVAPQVFAWRRGRLRTFGASCDALAVLFAFEAPLWRGAGMAATFVGHPLAERSLGEPSHVAAETRRVALLPGSRAGEVERLLPPFLGAAARWKERGIAGEALLAACLPADVRRFAEASCRRASVPVRSVPPDRLLPMLAGYSAALAASGTATLECALAGVPPVIAYRIGAVGAALFRYAHAGPLRSGGGGFPRIGLPNLLLGRDAFPELLQEEITPEALDREVRALLLRPAAMQQGVRDELLPHLAPMDGSSFGKRVARLVVSLAETGAS